MNIRLSSLIIAAVFVCGISQSLQAVQHPEIDAVNVRGGVHVLHGVGGNVGVSVGSNGVLLVDAGYEEAVDGILAAVRDLCGRESATSDLRFLVNTHWHFDHTGGNETIAAEGAIVIGHENVERLMSTDQVMVALENRQVPAAPESARPSLSFNDRVNLSWNGDLIHIVHIANAHSNGDAIVHFRDADIVHTGDLFFNGQFPYIDIDNGGNIGGLVEALDEILAHTNESTLFIPGHGPVADRQDLLDYRNMLATVRDRIGEMVDRGSTREEVVAAKPTSDLDAQWGAEGSLFTGDFWVGLVFDGMLRSRADR